MAAGNWLVFNESKQKLLNGGIDLDAAGLKMRLYKGTSNAATLTLSAISEVTNQVTTNVKGGGTKALTTNVVVGANASTYKFTFTSIVFSTSGGNVTSIKYAVIYVSGTNALVCVAQLSATAFGITSNNTLTISCDATNGAFRISGAST